MLHLDRQIPYIPSSLEIIIILPHVGHIPKLGDDFVKCKVFISDIILVKQNCKKWEDDLYIIFSIPRILSTCVWNDIGNGFVNFVFKFSKLYIFSKTCIMWYFKLFSNSGIYGIGRQKKEQTIGAKSTTKTIPVGYIIFGFHKIHFHSALRINQ